MKIEVSKGFTLLEAIVVVALLGILAAAAYPGFQSTLANNRAKAAQSAIDKALAYARSEAISRNRAVFVCPKAASNPDICGTGTDWANGFMVVVDQNNNNALDNATDTVIQHHYLKQPVHISTTGNKDKFTWYPGGRKFNGSTTITITPSADGSTMTDQQKTCTIAFTGRMLCP